MKFEELIRHDGTLLEFDRHMKRMLARTFGLGSRMTHTFALLELSPMAYEEIRGKLLDASYDHAINTDGTIDMHGIGIACDLAVALETTESGWLIESGDAEPNTRYRTLNEYGMSIWTKDRDMALRFARRADAEAYSREDEDAWSIREHFWPLPTGTAIPMNDEGVLMYLTISKSGAKVDVVDQLTTESQSNPVTEVEGDIRKAIATHLRKFAKPDVPISVTCSISLSYAANLDIGGKEQPALPPAATEAEKEATGVENKGSPL